MTAAIALLIVVTLQRFAEFIWDRQNTQRLRVASAVEFGGLHYPAVIAVHAGWLAAFGSLAAQNESARTGAGAFVGGLGTP
jgi:methyltransferase